MIWSAAAGVSRLISGGSNDSERTDVRCDGSQFETRRTLDEVQQVALAILEK